MKRVVVVAVVVATLAAACSSSSKSASPAGSPTTTATATKPRITTVVLLTHSSFAVSKSVLAAFTAQTGYKVRLVQPGDAGVMVNEAILRKGDPVGRRVVRRRQHLPDPRPRRRDLRRRTSRAGSIGARRVAGRPAAPRHADRRERRRASTTTCPGSATTDGRRRRRRSTISSTRATRTSRWSRTRRPRRPGSRSCSRRSRRRAKAAGGRTGPRCAHNGVRVDDDWTTAYETDFTAGGGEWRPADRGLVRIRSGRRRRRLEPAPRHAERRCRTVDVLPADGVRGRPARRAQRPRRRGTRRLHADPRVPGRHAAPDVRGPDRHGFDRCPRSSPSGRSTRRSRTRSIPRRSPPSAATGSRSGPISWCS